MKKIVLFFIAIIVIISIIAFNYYNYKAELNNTKRENIQYENYYQKEIYGHEIATVVNKAVDSNEHNNIEKNENRVYINNENNSINIEIKITDNDVIYTMETLYSGGMVNFVEYYGTIKFKCTQIEYHEKTGKVSYMLFEQITQ